MRILLMGFSKIKYMPYLNFYLENIDKNFNDVHIIYWNRDLQEEELDKYTDYTLHEFRCYQNDDEHQIKKINSFYKYRLFAKKIVKSITFDLIIVLHTFPGVLLFDVLHKYFKGKYIYDFRDITYEKFLLFKMLVGKIVANSAVTFVSSNGFRSYLPSNYKNKIYTSHNILLDSLNHRNIIKQSQIKTSKIKVAFWGFIRHKIVNIGIIDRLANDNRFELHYYGREQQIALELKEYARLKSANNIFFHGEYIPTDRYNFIKQTDVIHNLYYDTNTLLAMGNKFYDGIIFRIPQICTPNSHMAVMCEKYNVGIALDYLDESFSDKLFSYLTSLNVDEFSANCDYALSEIIDEYNGGTKIIKKITNSLFI